MTDPDAVRRSFGIVFQDPSLDVDLTAWENMELHGVLYGVPRGTRRARIDELLKFVDLADRRRGYVREFSGGMKRRLEIARGLFHHPKIIFLDEPTLGLDPQTRNHMWEYVGGLNERKGITVFFTTHYMDEAVATRTRSRSSTMAWSSCGRRGRIEAASGKESLEEAFLN